MTRTNWMARWGTATAVVLVLGGARMTAQQAAGAQAPAGTEVYSADVVVEDAVVDARGVVVESRPATRYHLSTRRTDAGLETELRFEAARLFPKGPLTDPRSGHRIVLGADGAPRVYDAQGRLVPGTDAGLPPFDASAEQGRLVFADRDVRHRRAALGRDFGAASGKVGRHERFLRHDGDRTIETLVDPDSSLPVFVAGTRGGALEQQSALSYGRMPGGRWYLASVRSEAATGDGSGRRFVSRRTHMNVMSTEAR